MVELEVTLFNVNPTHPSYNITVTQVREGTTSIDKKQFHLLARDKRRPPDPRIPFDMSPDANPSLIPRMSLTMQGGRHFTVYDRNNYDLHSEIVSIIYSNTDSK
ncbi:hypothetical protein BDE02_05G092300 [Populus trichocarpa]|nr:hypothetical protein BDE02_05G092300 [Populus trichocarpa]